MNRIESAMRQVRASAVTAIAAWAPTVVAGEFAIIPLRVDLDRANRASEVTIRNEDKAPLRMHVEAMRWQQSADGKDVYEPADGLIYFPRALELAPGESRVVRVGIRAAPVTREETYRLFISELPRAENASGTTFTGASLRVLLRVGVPIFVAPTKPERKAKITRLETEAGQVTWTVANEGNVHFVAEQVEIAALTRDGTRLHVQRFQERYFLAGVAKRMRADIPQEVCAQAIALEASVQGENLDLRRKVDVEPGTCR